MCISLAWRYMFVINVYTHDLKWNSLGNWKINKYQACQHKFRILFWVINLILEKKILSFFATVIHDIKLPNKYWNLLQVESFVFDMYFANWARGCRLIFRSTGFLEAWKKEVWSFFFFFFFSQRKTIIYDCVIRSRNVLMELL